MKYSRMSKSQLAQRLGVLEADPALPHEAGSGGAVDRELGDLKAARDAHAIMAITAAHGKIAYVNYNLCEISQCCRAELPTADSRQTRLRITEDGSGFSATSAETMGTGLRTMQFQTAVIGAKLVAESRETGGVTGAGVLPQSCNRRPSK